MDWHLVSSQEHEIEHFARKHGTTVEKVRAIIAQTKSRSRREFEAESGYRGLTLCSMAPAPAASA